MRTIIAGSRGIVSPAMLEWALRKCGWRPSLVLCGMARGADTLGLKWARAQGTPVEEYPADWDKHGKPAGLFRNTHMVLVADALIALWDGQSPGTKHMISEAQKHGLRVHVERLVPLPPMTRPPLPLHPRAAGARLAAGDGFATVLPDMDFETASEAGYFWDEADGKWIGPPGAPSGKNSKGLGAVGVANYAQHPSTRVLSFAYDLKDGRGRRWWRPGFPNPSDLFAHLAAGGLIEAHNSPFEVWIWNEVCTRLYGWPRLDPLQARCSMAKCRVWAMPGALDNVGEVLNIEHQKDPQGKRLLDLFSVPQKPTKKQPLKWLDPVTHPEGPLLYAYNDRDIVAESEVSVRVPDLSADELAYWQDDQEINRLGVHIDMDAMHACCDILDQAEAKYGAELEAITGGIKATQLAQLIGWLHAQGVHTDSLDEDRVASLLARSDLPPAAHRAIQIRSLIGSASVKKVRAMRNTVTAAGTLHDTYVFAGAHTLRPTGQGVQTVNLPKAGPNVYKCGGCGKWHGSHTLTCPWCGVFAMRKPKTAKEWNPEAMEDAFRAIATRSLATLEHYFGDALWTVAGCLRGLFVADTKPGEWEFVSSDFTAIEGVVIACLAGEQWRIDAYANPDPKAPSMYLLSAARMFGTPIQELLDYPAANGGQHHPLRQKGKGGELGLGFAGWVNALRNFGVEGTDDELKSTVLAWRAASPAIEYFWGGQRRNWQPCEPFGLEGMAIKAIQNPGTAFPVMRLDGTHTGITFRMLGSALYGYAPGGRLTYHRPRLHDTGTWRGLTISYEGWNSNPANGPMGWMRRDTYGGKLAENFTQHVARNIQMGAIRRLKARGYDVRMHTYDEAVCRVPVGWGSVEEVEAIMCDVQPWAKGWPIKAAGGWRAWRYRKG